MEEQIYNAVKDVVDGNVGFIEVIHLISKTMEAVGRIREMTGNEKKEIVLNVVRRVIREKVREEDRDKALRIIDDIGSEVIEGLYWAGRQSKHIFRQAKRWCC